jgi:hypothetical protein
VGACQGCRTQPAVTADVDAAIGPPTVRLYVLSTVAGAIEPCGCSKDQLGGIDHLAALLESQAAEAPHRIVLGAGPLLFSDPSAKGDQAVQSAWKAEALAAAAKDIGLAAWAPGANDWAGGAEALVRYRDQSGAALLGANLSGAPFVVPSVLREAGAVKIGIVGVSDPRDKLSGYPQGIQAAPALDAMRGALADLKQRGARILVGVAAMPRGEALRLADALPELHVLIIGKPSESGHGNDGARAPALVGSTLVVETPNHLQSVGVVDLFVRGGDGEPVRFADAGGMAKAEQITSLAGRIRDLEGRINSWEKSSVAQSGDLAARKEDLARLRAEKAKLEEPEPAPAGSFFRYRAVEVREKLGSDAQVSAKLSAYYKRVNEHNKTAFADRKPPPAEDGQASYMGVDACTDCHDDERKVWDKTGHAHAYATLQKDFKEYNLDCVSCHVTGYGKPGGSTVTWNEKLRDVQCEQCHGPGSLHAKSPTKPGLITLKQEPETCVSACHHPPHVEGFDPVAKMKLILGPGHGE